MRLINTINALYIKQLGRLPDLDNPTGYNDKIQWLKLHDQRPDQITACDKLATMSMVPEDYVIPLTDPDEYPRVIKCNHDSGSVRIAHNEHQMEMAVNALAPRLGRPYGIDKGEWAYQYIKPQIFTQRYMAGAAVDYKFHCVHGRVAWIQVIWNRGKGTTTECILTPDARPTGLHMDEKMIHAHDCPHNPDWQWLTEVAEQLAAPYRYVRIDLYWHDGQPWFGEFTFWPRAGCYRSADEPVFGQLLAIDLSMRLPRCDQQ